MEKYHRGPEKKMNGARERYYEDLESQRQYQKKIEETNIRKFLRQEKNMEKRNIRRILNQKENMEKKQTKCEDKHEPKKEFQTKEEYEKKKKVAKRCNKRIETV